MSGEPLVITSTQTPNGNPVRFHTRVTTNDAAVTHGILGEDEYGLRGERISGWVIDIGAHIGIVACAIGIDFPDTRIVAVEAIPDNAELVQKNVDLNGLSDRVFVESAGASAPGKKTVTITYDYESVGTEGGTMPRIDLPYVRDCRYIGNIFEYPEGEQVARTDTVPALPLAAIIAKYEIDRVALLKIDCEGCEYAFLSDPRANAKVDRMIGEFHRGPDGIRDLLRKTHDIDVRLDRGGVGIFEATAK